jgi:hypothetical protein
MVSVEMDDEEHGALCSSAATINTPLLFIFWKHAEWYWMKRRELPELVRSLTAVLVKMK